MTLPARFVSPYRLVGAPSHWSLKAAQLGATLPLASAGTGAVALALLGAHDLAPVAQALGTLGLVGSVCGAIVGGAMGFVAPAAMDLVRKRVPLWLLAPAHAAVGSGAGALTGALMVAGSAWLDGPIAMPGLSSLMFCGAMLGGLAATLWWLPFTMATVTGQRWPVTSLVGLLTPVILMSAWWLAVV